MFPYAAYPMFPQGILMPQQFSAFQATAQTPASSTEETGEETPAFVYPQQIPMMYSQVPGYGGYGDGVSAVPVVFPSYGMNVPLQESSYFYGQAPSSQERAMPPESGGALGR